MSTGNEITLGAEREREKEREHTGIDRLDRCFSPAHFHRCDSLPSCSFIPAAVSEQTEMLFVLQTCGTGGALRGSLQMSNKKDLCFHAVTRIF